ncbi:unnamed protein product, partial [Symbiodinium microadriaticum]
MMRTYLEQRVPLADHRLLQHVAALAAFGWEMGYKAESDELKGFCSRLLLFVEQAALDSGKVQLAYLLAGFPDPSPVGFAHRRAPGLKTFSRLAAPQWLAANLAYLKDLDYAETRIQQMATARPPNAPPKLTSADQSAEPSDDAEKPPRRPLRRQVFACWSAAAFPCAEFCGVGLPANLAAGVEGDVFSACEFELNFCSWCRFDPSEVMDFRDAQVGQAAHFQVLRQHACALHPDQTLLYRHVVPQGDTVEMLSIDDHICLQKVPLVDIAQKPQRRDTIIFDKATTAYKLVGLNLNDDKKRRNLTKGVLLGAEIDGVLGVVGPPRDRTLCLALLTTLVAKRGHCTRELLERLLGSWIHAVMFRRPVFAVLDQLFREGLGKPRNLVFKLSDQAKNELLMLSCLASTLLTDLRASYDPRLYCLDASPQGGAVCAAQVSCTTQLCLGQPLMLGARRSALCPLVYAITAVQDRFPQHRNFLTSAWQIDKKWQRAEPGECRPVLPAACIRAAVSLGLLWGWFRWTAALIIGFLAMLHPGELVALTRKDLVFPADTLDHSTNLFVIDDEWAIKFLYSLAHGLRLDEKLYPGSLHSFRRQWDAVLSWLGLPTRAAVKGATPGVLRGSGATHFYLCTENIPLLAVGPARRRWSNIYRKWQRKLCCPNCLPRFALAFGSLIVQLMICSFISP